MTRLSLRLLRTSLIAWLIGLLFLISLYPIALSAQFPTLEDRATLITTSQTSGSVNALYGTPQAPGYLGQITAWEGATYLLILSGVAAILLASRHAVSDEAEVVAPMGGSPADIVRSGILLGVSFGTGLALGLTLLLTVFNAIYGEYPLGGSITLGLLAGGTFGVYFLLTILLATVTADRRSTRQLAFIALACAVALRAVANSADTTWLSWATPIGWLDISLPFTDDSLGPIILAGVLMVLFAVLSLALSRNREFREGTALLNSRASRYHPPRSVLGLIMREHRLSILIWSVITLGFGSYFGMLSETLIDLIENDPVIARYFDRGGELLESYAVFAVSLLCMLAAIAAIQILYSLGGEEDSGRLEMLLGSGASRRRAMMRSLMACAAWAALLTVGIGLALGATSAMMFGRKEMIRYGLWAGLTAIPGVLCILAICAALLAFGLRLRAAGWLITIVAALISTLGRALKLPQWLQDSSPFAYASAGPSGHVLAWVLMIAVALLCAVVAVSRYPRRDVLS